MKILFSTLLFVLSAGLSLSQETPPQPEVTAEVGDEVYENLVHDMCSCFTIATEGLSEEMIKVIEDAGISGAGLQEAVMGHTWENPEQNEKDMEIIANIGGDELFACIDNLEKKYENADIEGSQELLLELFKKTEGCGLTYAFMLEGTRQ